MFRRRLSLMSPWFIERSLPDHTFRRSLPRFPPHPMGDDVHGGRSDSPVQASGQRSSTESSVIEREAAMASDSSRSINRVIPASNARTRTP